MKGKSVFSVIDLKDGFHLLNLHPEHTKYFAFATPDGQFEYNKLPFGYCEASEEFQKRLNQVLQSLIRSNKVCVYMDDILIYSESVEENLEIIKQVLVLLKQYQLKINYKKSCFLKTTIEYLGYIISPSGITLSSRHIDAVKNFPQPRKVVEVQRFLGFTNYFRKFIKNYALKAKPLQNLLRKTVNFKFYNDCIESFELLKKELTASPILQLYNPLAETELHTDASSF